MIIIQSNLHAFTAMQVSEIVTVNLEHVRLWNGLLSSNPSRVVHALALGFDDRPNQWGDTLAVSRPNTKFTGGLRKFEL